MIKIHVIISISHTKLSINLELIHQAVFEKLRFEKISLKNVYLKYL